MQLRSFTLTILTLSFFFLVPTASRSERRGEVTSSSCPYSCKTQGIPKKHCRDWKSEGLCYVEDLRRSPTKPTDGRSGLVRSAPCPFSCASQRIPRSQCRDWQKDGLCYVEDLRAGANTTILSPPDPTIPGRPVIGAEQCRQIPRNRLARPWIDIYRVRKTGNFFKSKYRVEGTIEGVCLVEAGRFEEGRKDEDIPIRTNPEFERYDFSVTVNSSRDPEIRVYNIYGERAVVEIDPSDYDSNGRPLHGSRDTYYRERYSEWERR